MLGFVAIKVAMMVPWRLLSITSILVAVWTAGSICYHARDIFIPLIGAGCIASLTLPLAEFFEKKLGRTAAAVASTSLVFFVLAALLVWAVFLQIAAFYQDIPLIQASLEMYGKQIYQIVAPYTNGAIQTYESLFMDWISRAIETVANMIFTVTSSVTYLVAVSVFVFFYVLFFIAYRERFFRFLLSIVAQEQQQLVRDVIMRVKHTLSQYLLGVVAVICVLFVYNMLFLHALDIPYATLWAIMGAVLYIIPYIGIIISAIFPTLATLLLRQEPYTALLVLAIFAFNQVIENNILTPYIVGGRVRINPLFSIVAVFVGGTVWGIAGMILFIPLVGVMKVVCDTIPSLRPYGYILGTDTQSEIS